MISLHFHHSARSIWLASLIAAWCIPSTPAFAADVGDPAPYCAATDISYSITNLAPSDFCWSAYGPDITVTFDVNIWNPGTRYNFAVGFTAAGDPTLQDITCLDSGIDLDSVGCDDYDSSGTASNPVVTRASLNVSCNIKGDNVAYPSAPVDLYLNYDAVSGGNNAEVSAQQCLLKEGVSFPYQPAGLDMQKSVINNNGGTAMPGDWTLNANLGYGVYILSGNGWNTSNGNVLAGDYILSEQGPSGYELEQITCTGSTFDPTTSTLSLKPGERANCIFTNNDGGSAASSEASLTLIKNVVNDNGGVGVADDFDLSINATEVISGTKTTVDAGVQLIISELDTPGYKEGVWSCIDNAGKTTSLPNNGLATGTALNLEPDSDVVCTIENNDLDINLGISKSVTDMAPSVGDVIGFSLLVSNTGSDMAVDVAAVDILPAGLSYVAGSIAGGNTTSDTNPTTSGLQWTISSLSAGSTTTLSYQATVLER